MTNERLSRWFGLSYASWAVLPRVIMQAMPDEWQERMAALLEEADEAFPGAGVETRVHVTEGGKLIKTPPWLLNYRHPDMEQIDKLRRAGL